MNFQYRSYRFANADERIKLAVWQKGRQVLTHNPAQHRQDMCGAWMQYDQHGQEGDYGWEIDHIIPVARGGTDDLSNLQPLWWRNNRRKSDNYPWACT